MTSPPSNTPSNGMINLTDEVSNLLRAGCPVAFGVSGGKDSTVLVLAGNRYLDQIGHPREQRVLIHADLGIIEWAETPEWVERLAVHVGLDLVTVRRPAGGLIERWETRWKNNVARYEALECVTLITPWSTPKMRFCTSELKVAPITAALRKRFPGQTILSATGIRAQESSARAKAPIAKAQPKLCAPSIGTAGFDWHPILDWKIEAVLALHESEGFPLHPAYTEFGSSRLSCSLCILAKASDHQAALRDPRNHPAFYRIVELELQSCFSFTDRSWVGDLRHDLLSDDQLGKLSEAKDAHARRNAAEALIPDELLYVKGWPTRVPTVAEAELLAKVRTTVNNAMSLSARYLDAVSIRARYQELMNLNAARVAA